MNSYHKSAATDGESLALMKWLSKTTKKIGVARHVYVVGGAIRNFVIDQPIKDIDMVVDSLSMRGKDAEWVSKNISRAIPTRTKVVTDSLMVSKIFIEGPWNLNGFEMEGEVIEIVNARKEEYEVDADGEYVGHKPIRVDPTTLEDDVTRREFTFNTLMWRLSDLAQGPDKAEIIDLTGCGIKDLQNREMRCPQDADLTFKQDPTRIIRTIKFAFKYGFKLPKDVEAAAKRQAKGLKRIPSKTETVLKTIVLDNPQYKKAFDVMADLGVIDVLKEMMQENAKTFGSFMANTARSKGFAYMFDLMDIGLPVGQSISFLGPKEQQRFREISVGFSQDDAALLLAGLKQPGSIYKDKKFFGEMAQALQLDRKEMGKLGDLLAEHGQRILLKNPSLIHKARDFKGLLRKEVLSSQGISRTADLNPQLGWPGGPCHVVERIFNEVRAPRLRNHLVEKVEDGDKLTNPEANKIYDMETDRGTKIKFLKRLRITPHAQYRMDQRNVTVNDLRIALGNFGKAYYDSKSRDGYEYQSWSEDMAYGKEIVWVDKTQGRLVVVFHADGRGDVTIITVYFEGQSDPKPSGQCRIYDHERDMRRIASSGKRYDANPGFRKGQVFKTLKGSELTLLRIETHPRDPDYVEKVVFKIKRIHPKDLEPIGRYPGLMAQQYWSYPEPKVGDEFELINADLNLVRWPRVSYKPTYHAASQSYEIPYGKEVGKLFEVVGTGKMALAEARFGGMQTATLKKGDVIKLLHWKESTWAPSRPVFRVMEGKDKGAEGTFWPHGWEDSKTTSPKKGFVRPFNPKNRIQPDLDLKSPKKPKPPKKGEYLIDYLDGRPGEGTVGNKFEVMKPTKLKGGSSGRLEKGDIVLMHWWEGADGGYDTKNMIGAIPHFEKMGDTEFDEEVGIAGEDGGIAGAIDRKDSFLIDGGWWHPKKGVLRPYRGLTKRYLQEFRGGKKAARVASLPLMSPLYNMREVCKQIVLLEDHLNHPPKRCPDCISKHFLTIEALIEEAVSLDIKGEHEDLLGLPSFCRALQQSWLDGGSEQQIAQALRKLRKAYMPDCFEIRSASFIAGVYMSRGKHVCGK